MIVYYMYLCTIYIGLKGTKKRKALKAIIKTTERTGKMAEDKKVSRGIKINIM